MGNARRSVASKRQFSVGSRQGIAEAHIHAADFQADDRRTNDVSTLLISGRFSAGSIDFLRAARNGDPARRDACFENRR